MMKPEIFLTTKERAQRHRISENQVRIQRNNGQGPPFIRMGNTQQARVLYRLSDIEEWERQRTVNTAERGR